MDLELHIRIRYESTKRIVIIVVFLLCILDTSAEHSPDFDWVVAHVGNTYPQTVVTEVLGLGLTNFSTTPPQASKLSSVAGILGHLSTTHSKEVQHAFDQMLQVGR